jgi:glucosylceramidase
MRRRTTAAVLALCSAAASGTSADPPPGRHAADVYVTARDTGDRLARKPPVVFEPLAQPEALSPTVMVDPRRRFQVLEGIGGAFTDAAAETFSRLPEERQRELLTAYFDPDRGIGYSLGRTTIHSCDFSSESYTYVAPNDVELKTFSVEHDRRHRIPFIKAALSAARGELKLFASPWSPPGWMKTTGEMLRGGRLKPEHRGAWARYLVRFVEAYQQEGIPLWGLTVQNEPMAVQTWESCLFTAEEERDFVRDHLGPALEEAGLGHLKLMIWDHDRGLLYQRAQVVYEDLEAARYVWGAGFHWYNGDSFDNVRLLHDGFPDKALLFTEGCVYPFGWERLTEWAPGEQYARSVVRDLNNWATGWTDWNLLLDERGGPNHVGGGAMAPIIADTRDGSLHYMSSYYYLGHFSKFLRPGARRVAVSTNLDDLEATAFENPDGRLTVVVLNRSDREIPFHLWIDGQAAGSRSPAHSILTLVRAVS